MQMLRFRFNAIASVFLIFISLPGRAGEGKRSVRQLMGEYAIGRFEDGSLQYESLANRKMKVEYKIDSLEYETMCRGGRCEAAWSSGDGASWVAIRNVLNSQIVVVNQAAEVQWQSAIGVEVRSMLSVSKDGSTVAVIGRVQGVDSIWHVTRDSSRAVWRLPRIFRSERLQVGWDVATGGNVVSDGDVTMLCEGRIGESCRRLFAGSLPCLSPDGKMVAVSADENTVVVYGREDGRVFARFSARSGWATESAKWSPDSKLLILNEIVGNTSKLLVIELSSKRREYSLETYGKSTAHTGIVTLSSLRSPSTR